jgi:hypothetical protein
MYLGAFTKMVVNQRLTSIRRLPNVYVTGFFSRSSSVRHYCEVDGNSNLGVCLTEDKSMAFSLWIS